jgi:hypothetical protein
LVPEQLPYHYNKSARLRSQNLCTAEGVPLKGRHEMFTKTPQHQLNPQN